MGKDTQSTRFFCTFNNPQEYGYDYDTIIKTLLENFSTFIYGCICTEQGSTLHYHLLMVFSSRVRWSMITKHFPHVDVRKAKGSISQCKQYIMKSGKWEENEEKQHTIVKGSFQEWGIQPLDKGENDTAELLKMIQDGFSNAEIYNTNSEYIKQASIIEKIRYDIKSDEMEGKLRLNLEVTYIQGKTGTGKSRYIFENFDNVCVITNYTGTGTFDGLKPTHDVLVFEEYRNSLTLKEMLSYCDIYPISARSRYADKPIYATKIFIISNWRLEEQYKEEQVTDAESYQALLRRIHKVMVFHDKGEYIKYESVDEYFKANKISSVAYTPPPSISDEEFYNLMPMLRHKDAKIDEIDLDERLGLKE